MTFELNSSINNFFCSDPHYNHKNICNATSQWTDKSACRNYYSLDDMNAHIVKKYNEALPDDNIICLGDWSFGGFEFIRKFRQQIRCRNIYLILGNHDHHIDKNKDDIRSLFTEVMDYAEITIDNQLFICSHYPITSWKDMNKGSIHLHGHVHLPRYQAIHEGKAMDIGWDAWQSLLTPSLIYTLLHKHPNKILTLPQDHHETEIR